AKNAIAAVETADAANTIAVDERQDEYDGLYQHVANVKPAAAVEINDDAFNKDLNSLARKFQSAGKSSGTNTGGGDGGDNAAGGGETPVGGGGRSTSQRSYDMQIQHLTA